MKIGEHEIRAVPYARNIGAIFDEHLTMDRQVNSICKSAFFHLHRIGLIRKFLTTKAAATLIHAFVASRLDGLNSLLVGLPAQTIAKLQRVQNCAARIITGLARSEHITPVLNELHWLRVPERIEFKVLLLCHKCIIGTAPKYLEELVTPYNPGRNLRSADGSLLVQPRGRLASYGDRAFLCAAPRLWNSLPRDIREISSTPVFVRRLKAFLFARYSGP